jgi:hypothetical protein
MAIITSIKVKAARENDEWAVRHLSFVIGRAGNRQPPVDNFNFMGG